MLRLLQDIVTKCELSIRRDAKGTWQISAKGLLAMATLIALLVLWRWA